KWCCATLVSPRSRGNGVGRLVVQTRHSDWRRSPAHRRRAYAVSLHFALPGLMSLLALVDPANRDVWRFSFALSGAAGALILGYIQFSPIPTPTGRRWQVGAVVSIGLVRVV